MRGRYVEGSATLPGYEAGAGNAPVPTSGVLYVMKHLNNETNTRERDLWAYTELGHELTDS